MIGTKNLGVWSGHYANMSLGGRICRDLGVAVQLDWSSVCHEHVSVQNVPHARRSERLQDNARGI